MLFGKPSGRIISPAALQESFGRNGGLCALRFNKVHGDFALVFGGQIAPEGTFKLHFDQLVGGLYGINLGKIFTGESMFSTIPNVSKAGFIYLCHKLQSENYNLLDCQVYNEHLASLGAYEIPRKNFMKFLKGEI